MDIIHIVLGKANPNRMNGVNKVVHQLATRQSASGKNVQVWGISGDLTHNYDKRNFETRLFKKKRNPFAICSSLRNAIIQSENCVFHLHGGWLPVFWAIGRCFKKHNKKAVLTPHGAYNTIAMRTNSWGKKIYFKLFERQVLEAMNKIHCIGASEKTGLNNIYPNNKQLILPYGFDNLQDSTIPTYRNDNFVVGFVGRIDIHTKGLDILVNAFSQFSKNKKTKLWIVGDSAEMTTLETSVANAGIMNKTTLFGSKFGTEKDNLIQKMTVFAHPSRNEGLPTAVLEAASFGIPSIVTEATNVGTYIQKHDAGICVSNDSVDELVNALEEMYKEWKDATFDKFKNNNLTMLNTEFNWNNLVKAYDNLYE